MDKRFFGCALMAVSLLGAGGAQAQSFIAGCAAALTPTEVSGSDSLAVQYAYLSSKLESSDSSSSAGGGITVPVYGVPVSLNYSQAEAKKQQLASTLGVNWDAKHSQAYMARYVSASSNSAFTKCVRDVINANKAILLEITDAGADYVNVKVHIGTQPASPNDVELDLSSNGGFSHGVQRLWRIAGGTTTVVINRTNPGRDLHISARIRGAGYELGSDEIIIPPAISTVRRFTTGSRISQPSEAHCGGVRGRVEQGRGDTVTMNAEANESFDIGAISPEEVSRVDGRPDVAMNPAQYHMEILASTPKSISARAWCGVWANEHYSWTGRIRVSTRISSETVITPRDNSKSLAEVRAPGP